MCEIKVDSYWGNKGCRRAVAKVVEVSSIDNRIRYVYQTPIPSGWGGPSNFMCGTSHAIFLDGFIHLNRLEVLILVGEVINV